MVTYHYWRYYSQHSEEMATLPEALARAKYEVECNTAHPEKIVLEDGTELDCEEILERSGYYSCVEFDGVVVDGSVVEDNPTRLLE